MGLPRGQEGDRMVRRDHRENIQGIRQLDGTVERTGRDRTVRRDRQEDRQGKGQ